jgi:O-antigen/teichoic acid export membrane protein
MVTERLALVTLGTCALVLSMDVTRIMTWFCVIKVLDLTVSLVVANKITGTLSPRFRMRWIRWILLSILPFFATMALVMAYNYFDILMLGHFRDEADVGIYGAIYTFFAALVLVPSAFSNAYLPSMSKAHDESSNELRKSAESALRLLFVMSAPVVVGTLAGASELLQIVFGSDFLRGAMGLRILMLSTPCVFLFWFLRSTLIAIGEIRKLLWVTATGLSINIALNIVLIPEFGIAGACVATLAAEFVLLVLASRLVAATNIKVVTYRTALAFLVTGICFAFGMLAGHLVTTWWLAGIPAGVILAHFALCRIDFWSSEELVILRRFRLAW